MRVLTFAITLLCAAPSWAQSPVTDIGLTVDDGTGPIHVGQQCGPVSCSPLPVGPAVRGQARTFGHGSAPLTPYLIGMGFTGPCVTIPGITNGLLLDAATLQVVAAGITSHEPFVPTPCNQGVAAWVMTLPATAPLGLTFRVQSLGQSRSGPFALGPTLEFVLQ